MKNVEALKKKYLEEFAHKYYGESSQKLSGDSFRRCSMIAEIWAYMEAIIPEESRKCTVFDFEGYIINSEKKRQMVMPEDVALVAKNIICSYCWGKTWVQITEHYKGNEEYIKKFLRSCSVMMNRLDKGNNLIIFGESNYPIGRTMMATIAMKEAIKLRVQKGQRGQTYEWIDFNKLKSDIINDTFDVSDYRSCNWLVVDNINRFEYATIQQKAYVSEQIDSFFIGRLNDNLPTIFVFKFDIRNKSFDVEKEMGTGISKIVSSNNTFKIPLCKEFKTSI